MILVELLRVCSYQSDTEFQVMINGEGVIGTPCILESFMSENVLNASVSDIVAEDANRFKVWVDV